MSVKAMAPAKINLGLAIKGKRNDGYHEIDTIMQSVNLQDVIEVSINKNRDIKIECEKILNCNEQDNIAYKAATKFFKYTGIENPGITIKIKKNIPICAGLAGGSSDGAAVIVCLNKMFNTELSIEKMQDIGSQVGADVPFCILGGTARARGTGTHINKISNMPECGIVIVKPDCDVSTKKAYQMYDIYGSQNQKNIEIMINLINSQNLKEVSNYLFNDFEEFISNTKIHKVKSEILKNNPLGMCMSGSGPSVFGIFRKFCDAELCVNILKEKYIHSYACKPISHGIKILSFS